MDSAAADAMAVAARGAEMEALRTRLGLPATTHKAALRGQAHEVTGRWMDRRGDNFG
jgi:hypothetical protein